VHLAWALIALLFWLLTFASYLRKGADTAMTRRTEKNEFVVLMKMAIMNAFSLTRLILTKIGPLTKFMVALTGLITAVVALINAVT
jgi:hypothetical protein